MLINTDTRPCGHTHCSLDVSGSSLSRLIRFHSLAGKTTTETQCTNSEFQFYSGTLIEDYSLGDRLLDSSEEFRRGRGGTTAYMSFLTEKYSHAYILVKHYC